MHTISQDSLMSFREFRWSVHCIHDILSAADKSSLADPGRGWVMFPFREGRWSVHYIHNILSAVACCSLGESLNVPCR